ncbi:MAG: GGDEF domain-containing protein, partial [Acidobacteriota bacterium]|nr:GGDEF domain-containing protein [Acidobacteriota bacterium]
DFWVTVSAGLADASGASALDPGQLLARADRALYAAKAGGRNRVRVWTERLEREGKTSRRENPAPPPER